MANQPLGFAELLAGGVLIVSGVSGHSIRDVMGGVLTPIVPLASGSGSTMTSVQAPATSAGVLSAANQISQENNPYKWGGGHVTNPLTYVPELGLDCSGAVSYLFNQLGIMQGSLTSTQFMTWGDPGPGKLVTIYSDTTHVFLKIGNRYWGTGSAHPNGGAGWQPAPSASYLAKFAVRHPPGL